MARLIVSKLTVVGGAPAIDGTRLSCADVARNLEGLEIAGFLRVYSELNVEDVVESLTYCAEQRCVRSAIAFCHSCKLRSEEPEETAVWMLSKELLSRLQSSE